jgi:hypothetical protein
MNHFGRREWGESKALLAAKARAYKYVCECLAVKSNAAIAPLTAPKIKKGASGAPSSSSLPYYYNW